MALTDLTSRYIATNSAFQNMLGYTHEEFKALTAIEITHPDERATSEAVVAEFASGTRQEYHVDKRYMKKDGTPLWVNVTITYVPATDVTPPMLQGVIINIDDRIRAEHALQRSQAELARVTRVTTMGELAASIAHEINQPLAAIVARGNACRRWLEVQNLARAKESLDRVIADADRACEVIKRVRSLTSKAPLERRELNINVVVKEVLAITRGELQARQVSLQLQLNEDIPLVTGDKVELQQVVLNLVMNAIDAMAAVTRRRVLSIRSQRGEDGGALVTVQDCGHGLDPASAERIFHPFFTTKPGGMGMGLSISTSIVETHGGRLWAASVRPFGTAFHFTLPRAGEPWPT